MQQQGVFTVAKQFLQETGSKLDIYRQYDHHIGTKTIMGPEDGGAGLLWIRSDWADPKEAYLALPWLFLVRKILRNASIRRLPRSSTLCKGLMASGAWLAVTDCLNFGNPEQPEIMEEFSMAIDGIAGLAKSSTPQ